MQTLHATIEIEAPATRVWEISTTFRATPSGIPSSSAPPERDGSAPSWT